MPTTPTLRLSKKYLTCKNCQRVTEMEHAYQHHMCQMCNEKTYTIGKRGMGKTSSNALAGVGNAVAGVVGLGVGAQILTALVEKEDLKTKEAKEEELLTDEIENILKENLKENTIVWTEPDGSKTKLSFDEDGKLIDRSEMS